MTSSRAAGPHCCPSRFIAPGRRRAPPAARPSPLCPAAAAAAPRPRCTCASGRACSDGPGRARRREELLDAGAYAGRDGLARPPASSALPFGAGVSSARCGVRCGAQPAGIRFASREAVGACLIAPWISPGRALRPRRHPGLAAELPGCAARERGGCRRHRACTQGGEWGWVAFLSGLLGQLWCFRVRREGKEQK